ncbi:MAG: glucoamylase family protein [Ignavibacteriales bacterium]
MKLTATYITFFICAALCASCNAQTNPGKAGAENSMSPAERSFLDTLQKRTFDYFWYESGSENGLVKDRSQEGSPASMAATGFGIAAWAVGAEHGWISRAEAAERTLRLLRFLINSPQGTEPDATGYKGFYYHFINMTTGKRAWHCELSTIDTAWLLAGVRFAVQYFNRDTNAENEIRQLAEKITGRVDWNWSVLRDGRYKGYITLGWTPEEGFHELGWFGYNEALMLQIIAAGSGIKDPLDVYGKWLSSYNWVEPYKGLEHFGFPPLFGHQYSHMFIDFRGLADSRLAARGIDYFENSRRASLAQIKYAVENPMRWKGYDSLCWGLTACDGPGDSYNHDSLRFLGYAARGTSGSGLVHDDDGTIAPAAAGGSIVFIPQEVIKTLKNMYDKYGPGGLWGRYGFTDAFNPTLNWYDKDYLGIDQGPILLMIENLRSGMIWKYMKNDEVVKTGLEKLGFIKTNTK